MLMATINSSIRDNHKRGTVGDFLIDNIKNGSELSIVSAYFTIYAYEKLIAYDFIQAIIEEGTIKIILFDEKEKIIVSWKE